MRRFSGLGFGVLALSACVAPRQAPPPPPPAPTPAPTPAPAPAPPPADWRDRAYSPGDWSFAGGEARYGPLALACDRAGGQVRLSWTGAPAGPLTIRTSYADAARQAQAETNGLMLAIGARDPLLDQIAFSRGRFMLQAGAQELILPSWPEISRLVEECR
jgi:hypothetical protein